MARRPIAAALADTEDQNIDQGDQRAIVNGEVEDDVEQLEDDVEELEDDLAADDADPDEPLEPRQRERRPARVREPDEDRLAAIERRAEAAERRAEAAERTAREAQERYQQRQEPVETPEQEAAKLALMTPYEQLQYSQRKIDKALANHDQRVQRGVLQASNAADKSSFEAFVSDKPQLKKIAADVEKKHAELMAQGATPSRMDVAKYMLGELALKASQTPEARKANNDRRDRVQRQQARPGTPASDVRGERRRGNTLEDRLANVQI
jgi:hypothetical protein